MSEVQWQLPHSPRSAGRVRALLRTQLSEWEIVGAVADTAERLLSELVANSIQHARTPSGREIGVRFAHYDRRLRVEVADANSRQPEPRRAFPDGQGRGLTLVQSLAERWGCCPPSARHRISDLGGAAAATMSATNAAVLSEPPHITPNGTDEEPLVADAPLPPPDDDAVTVTLTYTGAQADVLRTLGLLEGRTPEEIALDHIARGVPLAFSSSLGEDSEAMAALAEAMFDGPADLATRSGEGLFGEAEGQ